MNSRKRGRVFHCPSGRRSFVPRRLANGDVLRPGRHRAIGETFVPRRIERRDFPYPIAVGTRISSGESSDETGGVRGERPHVEMATDSPRRMAG